MRAALREFGDLAEPRNVTLISAVHGVNEFFSIALPPIIPFLVSDLDITYAEAGLLLTVFFAMYSIFQLPAGVLADWLGKKRMMVGGMVCMAGGIFLAGAAEGYPMLVAAQVVAGIGGSTYHPTGKSLVSDFETKRTEGKAMGVHGFGGTLGTASAPLIIGGVAGLFDWRLALAVAAVLGFAVTALFVTLFADPDAGGDPPPGDRVQHDGGRAGLARRAYRNAVDAFRVPLTWRVGLLMLMATLVSMQTRAILTFTTSYVFAGAGQTISVANVVFFVTLFAGSFSQLAAGSLADRFDRGKLGVAASILTAALLAVAFALVEFAGGLPDPLFIGLLLASFFAIGIAMYASAPVKNALLSQYAEREFSGSLFGIAQTTSSIGSAASPAVFGYLATEHGMTVAYPLIAVVSVLIAATFLLLSRDAARGSSPA